ncbi:hypothetical protein [Nocardia anaemiae]|nr:hypothetical protein [Nocardia anaemiae]
MTVSLVLIVAGFILLSIVITSFMLPIGADAARHPKPHNETSDQ